MNVTSAPLAAQPDINQLCARYVGWHIDPLFSTRSLNNRVNAASIHSGAWFSAHAPIHKEYAE